MGIRNIIFDLDGTLLDTFPDIIDCLGIACIRSLGSKPKGFSKIRLGPALRDLITDAMPELSEEQVESVVSEFKTEYDKSEYPKTKPYMGVASLLPELGKKMLLFIATNKRRDPAVRMIALKGLGGFRDIATTDSFKGKATKAEILSHLLSKWGLSKDETIYVGDLPEDAKAAKEAGLVFAAALWGYGGKELLAKKPQIVLERPEDLLRIA